MKKSLLVATATSLLAGSVFAEPQELTFDELKAKCSDMKSNAQIIPFKTMITCTDKRTEWRKGEETPLSLKVEQQISARVEIKDSETTAWMTISKENDVAESCQNWEEWEGFASTTITLDTCEELNQIESQESYCKTHLADAWESGAAEWNKTGAVKGCDNTPNAPESSESSSSSVSCTSETSTSSVSCTSETSTSSVSCTSETSTSSESCTSESTPSTPSSPSSVSCTSESTPSTPSSPSSVSCTSESTPSTPSSPSSVSCTSESTPSSPSSPSSVSCTSDTSTESSLDPTTICISSSEQEAYLEEVRAEDYMSNLSLQLGAQVKSEKAKSSLFGWYEHYKALTILEQPVEGSLLASLGLNQNTKIRSVNNAKVSNATQLREALSIAKKLGRPVRIKHTDETGKFVVSTIAFKY